MEAIEKYFPVGATPVHTRVDERGWLHCKDEPAVVLSDGTTLWCLDNMLHRENDEPALVWPLDRVRAWFHRGVMHRADGPALLVKAGILVPKSWRKRVGRIKLRRSHAPTREERQLIVTAALASAGENKTWFQNGIKHRADGPAVERADGTRKWYVNGELHRVDGPAIEHADGTRKWYFHNHRHRVDGPAVVYPNGRREWYMHNRLHRVDGPAVISECGDQEWFKRGQRHRADGPAIVWAHGDREWFKHGQRHRDGDLPAIERIDGRKQYFLNGKEHAPAPSRKRSRDEDPEEVDAGHEVRAILRLGGLPGYPLTMQSLRNFARAATNPTHPHHIEARIIGFSLSEHPADDLAGVPYRPFEDGRVPMPDTRACWARLKTRYEVEAHNYRRLLYNLDNYQWRGSPPSEHQHEQWADMMVRLDALVRRYETLLKATDPMASSGAN